MSNHFVLKGGIGTIDAERDIFLEDYFWETQVFNDLTCFDENDYSFSKRVIVGRTGSGKTALLKKINSLPNMKSVTIEAESMIFEHIKNNVFINSLIENDIDIRIFYKSLWLHVLLIKVIELTFPKDNLLKSLQALVFDRNKLAAEYVETFSDNFFNENIISEITNKMQRELTASFGGDVSTVKSTVGGKQNNEFTEKIQSQTSRYVNTELLTKQKQVIRALIEGTKDKKRKYIISIDDLDRSWLNENSIRYDFINALLDAFRELLDIKNTKVLISIRTDILKGVYKKKLRQEEKDLSLISHVEWRREEIVNLLDKRISYIIERQYTNEGVTFEDLFNFQVLGKTAKEYILERTMLRPRDAIEYVNLCLSKVSGDVCKLNHCVVLEAEEDFYSSRKSALCSEWYSLFPNLRIYLDALSVFETNTINTGVLVSKKDEFCEVLLKSEDLDDDVISKCIASDFTDILNIWFVCGVIGRTKTEDIVIFSNHQKMELDITDFNKNFRIHPLFFRN
ncbi:P-loop ATPase, Sll1717 family [Acinetobacter johnsonii]|uniref:P-loop ATPase, Sll1717 family n=1 Tax=Acinetobacter johnsonii TaxID=40214 RepID=UPI00244AAC99|nr:P-loop NTPase fold protein [Acinetobacter johnsonii]MDH1276177.1 P-loop NTPase fold protein [Acinetobacter johnsonii]